jgi:hypothetical protein
MKYFVQVDRAGCKLQIPRTGTPLRGESFLGRSSLSSVMLCYVRIALGRTIHKRVYVFRFLVHDSYIILGRAHWYIRM